MDSWKYQIISRVEHDTYRLPSGLARERYRMFNLNRSGELFPSIHVYTFSYTLYMNNFTMM